MRFEWDPAKAAANMRKHGIDFRDAARALAESSAVDNIDERFFYGEERSQALCLFKGAVLFVAYTLRQDEGVCRIIMARKATRHEQKAFFEA